jgi:hypothetical protein
MLAWLLPSQLWLMVDDNILANQKFGDDGAVRMDQYVNYRPEHLSKGSVLK